VPKIFTTEDTESTEKKLEQSICAVPDFVVNSSSTCPDRESLQAVNSEGVFSVLSVSSVVNRVLASAIACLGRPQSCF
jgi:hypothetical protein